MGLSAAAFCIGLGVGKVAFASKAQTSNARADSKDKWGANVTDGGISVPVVSWLDNQLLPANIRNNLQNLTSLPHIAGVTGNSVPH